ncbi:MAG: Lpg1974 family pore-forming outer membrane protein [Planctomycetota bacterium]|nr:Lpg1974 family pore-forming outer membrane protein [Planctomycetota bacterium]
MKRIDLRLLSSALVLLTSPLAIADDSPVLATTSGPAAYVDYAPTSHWLAGADAVALQPHFRDNTAFTVKQSDGVTVDNFNTTNFHYDLGLSPRVWLEYRTDTDLALRTTFWIFDQTSRTESASPPANGFGEITHPKFYLVDISSGIPNNRFTAASSLRMYYADLEVAKRGSFSNWDLVASAGVRYGSVEQRYQAKLRDNIGDLNGTLDFEHRLEGFGPTIAVETRRQLTQSLAAFANLRYSYLFGEQQSTFAGGTSLIPGLYQITATSVQDDALSISEMQLGGEWTASPTRLGQWFVRGAFETQFWTGAGNASSLSGDLGLIGFSLGLGLVR